MNLLAGARLTARRILSNPSSTKRLRYLPPTAALQQCSFYSDEATATIQKTKRSWERPETMYYSYDTANLFNFTGNVKTPVRFETDSEGKHFAVAVICQGNALSCPVLLEGDLAHAVAFHVKEKDCVYVSGELSWRRWFFSESYGEFHAVAKVIKFAYGAIP